jgi:hypothetical protein
MKTYSFRIAFQTVEQMTENPDHLILTTLPNGLPSYKTVNATAESEAQALELAEQYVSKTQYQEIQDGITL